MYGLITGFKSSIRGSGIIHIYLESPSPRDSAISVKCSFFAKCDIVIKIRVKNWPIWAGWNILLWQWCCPSTDPWYLSEVPQSLGRYPEQNNGYISFYLTPSLTLCLGCLGLSINFTFLLIRDNSQYFQNICGIGTNKIVIHKKYSSVQNFNKHSASNRNIYYLILIRICSWSTLW